MKEFSRYKNGINRTWARFIVINANKKSTSNATWRSLWAIQWLFWGHPPFPPYLRVWMTAPTPPPPPLLSKDLDPPLAICCIYRIRFHSSPSRRLGYIKWTNSLVRQTETQLFTALCKGFRIPESWALGSGIQSRQQLESRIQAALTTKNLETSTWNPKSTPCIILMIFCWDNLSEGAQSL